MSSRPGLSALAVILIAVLGAVYTVVAGNQPLLGLDLQGGVSVVLQPTGEASDEALDQSVEIIRSRVDSLGVAEPEISRQGDTIVVDLPGVEEQQRALELVGRTAELRFRPVLFELGPSLEIETIDGEDDGTDGTDDGEVDAEPAADADTDDTTADDEESSMAGSAGRFAPLVVAQSDDGGETDPAAEDEADPAADDEPAAAAADAAAELDDEQAAIVEICSQPGTTAPEDDIADQPVVVADADGFRYCLGPTLLTGETLEGAQVGIGNFGQTTVNPTFNSGADGIDQFNAAASQCFSGTAICPSSGVDSVSGQQQPGRLAIVLDGRVVSAPAIQQPVFSRTGIEITGDFTDEEAEDLARVLRFGALPVELETQQTRTVSATIGDDVLRAGVIAGLLGLALVAVYLLAYYRLAGLVALGGLVLSALLLWTIIAWFGENLGLALTLAGVVGLIVSVGVSADSNIVYFENVKDAYRAGKTVPTSVERAYQSAISTIVKADAVSLIAAVLLYLLTVGAVRGFAFYLGLATLLDLFISWLFMRPALAFLARREAVREKPSLLGLSDVEAS
ncbi:MAG: protein translocase subunit SecD [Actinomycetota bacterium]